MSETSEQSEHSERQQAWDQARRSKATRTGIGAGCISVTLNGLAHAIIEAVTASEVAAGRVESDALSGWQSAWWLAPLAAVIVGLVSWGRTLSSLPRYDERGRLRVSETPTAQAMHRVIIPVVGGLAPYIAWFLLIGTSLLDQSLTGH